MPEERADDGHIPINKQDLAAVAGLELKKSRKKALNEFRYRVEDAILGDYLYSKKNRKNPPPETGKENLKLWGVHLMASVQDEGTDIVLTKFLKAKDYRVHEAFMSLRKTLKWRGEFRADGIVDEDLRPEPDYEWFSEGKDKEGRPLCYSVLGKKGNSGRTSSGEKCQDYMRWRVQGLEKGVEMLSFRPGGVHSFVQIIDLKNEPGPATREAKLIYKKMMALLHDHYPGIVHKTIIINVPAWFLTLNALNLRLISQKSKNKFRFVKPPKVTKALLKLATPENILVQYGGLKRENDTEFSTEDKVLEQNIKANSTHYIHIPINETNVILTWDVTVVGYDVTYKEEFVPDDEGSYRVLLQKEKKMGESVRNSFPIREPGKIVITMVNASFKKRRAFYRYKSKPCVPFYMIIKS